MKSDQHVESPDRQLRYRFRDLDQRTGTSAGTSVIVLERGWPGVVSRRLSALALALVFVTTCLLAVLVRPAVESKSRGSGGFVDSDDLRAFNLSPRPMYTCTTESR